MKVKSESEVAQSCPTLCDHIDSSPPGSSVHGIFQARILEWGAIAFSVICVRQCKYERKGKEEIKEIKEEYYGLGEDLYSRVRKDVKVTS